MRTNRLKTPVSDEDHGQGSENAKITIVEYGDFQCPFCGKAYPMVKRLQRDFGKDLRFIFRHFPLIQSHEHALLAAVAAEAAGAQSKFWEMHDKLFENQQNLSAQDILDYATELNLDLKKFDEDIKSAFLLNKVKADYLSGEFSDVNGTPSFFVNEAKYVGPLEYAELKSFIESMKEKPSASL
ncbi:DsbA family protein [Bdellovibrio sp. HCB337]|uniref:DsbA family protein n=1 Tax=Bdellovibrio sp. HCB337 TaxID=3394358 RepID=UPI0039A49FAC